MPIWPVQWSWLNPRVDIPQRWGAKKKHRPGHVVLKVSSKLKNSPPLKTQTQTSHICILWRERRTIDLAMGNVCQVTNHKGQIFDWWTNCAIYFRKGIFLSALPKLFRDLGGGGGTNTVSLIQTTKPTNARGAKHAWRDHLFPGEE